MDVLCSLLARGSELVALLALPACHQAALGRKHLCIFANILVRERLSTVMDEIKLDWKRPVPHHYRQATKSHLVENRGNF